MILGNDWTYYLYFDSTLNVVSIVPPVILFAGIRDVIELTKIGVEVFNASPILKIKSNNNFLVTKC